MGSFSNKTLGELQKVELRSIWANEASDFTPWLAEESSLATLGKTIGMDLELEAQEKSVGPFRADILCKDIGTNNWVLIENQLEKTDHTHLGQLLTYASGLSAVTIVWIAGSFTEEHRSTLDWLNKHTDDEIKFFGLEVEVWKIGDSLAAPKFNLVSKPNDWSRSVARAARSLDDQNLTELKQKQREYWEAFHNFLIKLNGAVSGNRKAQPQSWMTYPIGKSYVAIVTSTLKNTKQVRAEIYLSGPNAKHNFDLLFSDKQAVEEQLGFELNWDRLESKNDCRISVYLESSDLENKSDWTRQHEWLGKTINALHSSFRSRVTKLS